MEGDMARPRARIDLGVRRIMGRERAFGRVEAIDEYFVKTKIRGERKAIVGGGPDPVRVRPFVPFLCYAGTVELNEVSGFPERTVVVHWKACYASAIVIRDQSELAGVVQGDVAWSGAARGDLIQQSEFAGFRVDRKSARSTTFLRGEMVDFIYGVEVFAAGMQGEEGRIFGFSRNAQRA